MRTAYHEKLAALSEQIGQMCGLAAAAIDNATQALLRADLALAERVITDHMQMAEMSVAAERSAVTLLALQQPVAGELRAIFGSSQIVADVDRMGALAVHVAKIARHRHPRHAVPAEVEGCFAEMGRVAVELATRAQEVLRSHDPDKAAGLRGDDVMDNLYRDLLTVVMMATGRTGCPRRWTRLPGALYEPLRRHAIEMVGGWCSK
jgi:phosphate transport system protein